MDARQEAIRFLAYLLLTSVVWALGAVSGYQLGRSSVTTPLLQDASHAEVPCACPRTP